MRGSRWSSIVAVGLALIGAERAVAVTLPVESRLQIEIHALPPLVFETAGTVTVNGSGAGGPLHSLAIPGGLVTGSAFVPVTDPNAAPIFGVKAQLHNAAGTIGESGGRLRGEAGLPGYTKVCLFDACANALGNVEVPFTVAGAHGAQTASVAVAVTIVGAPWTTGTVAIGTITRMGFAEGPASAPNSTALPNGTLQLVTPIFVSTNIPPSAIVPVFGIWTLKFVPEPTTVALLAGGIAILAAAGRARSRERS
jgi:hypothetical protein